MYEQLPDYDEFQGYDLRIDSQLRQMSGEIYANCHKPSRKTMKRHLFQLWIPKRLLRHLEILAGNGKKDDFKQGGNVAVGRKKIQMANTFSESVEMDFAYYGDYGNFCTARALSRDSKYRYLSGKRKRGAKLRKCPAKRRFRIG